MKKILLCLGLLVTDVNAHHIITKNEKECMVLAVYHEGRSEPELGQYAIMDVIKNRSDSDKFPKHNICDVIKREKQFSFYNKGWKSMKNLKVKKEIEERVESYYNGLNVGITNGSKWYHAVYVQPKWSKNLNKVIQIGNHIFYNEK